MCGICGIYNFDNKNIEKSKLRIMNDQMIDRGPDSEGYLMDNNFGMAMRRLSIIDLEKSIQPMQNSDKNISITFNGEIYNFIELREELKKENIKFKTTGDTEVILKLYEKLGEKFIQKLIGMFSICIFDKTKKKVLIYRDRFGIKPLYYYISQTSFYFSSSLFSLKKVLNLKKSKESFFLYLCFNYFPSTKSVYENVYSLLPGNFIKIQNNKVSIDKYYDFNNEKHIIPTNKYDPKIFKEIMNNSISINLRSDVNLGLMMSSGIDSSIIANESFKLNKNLKAYTVNFEDKLDNEGFLASKFANELKINHEIINLKKDETPDLLNQILKNMDEPCADTAIIPSYLISKKAKQDNIKVLLSGAGGDEIFAGYSRHYLNFYTFFYGIINFLKIKEHRLLKIFPFKIQNILFKSLDKKYAYVCNTSGQNLGVILASINNSSHKKIFQFIEKILDGIINSNFVFDSKNIINADLSLYLPGNILRPFDKVSMMSSVEGRVPFLDHRFLEIINYFNLNMASKGSSKNNKKILKSLYRDELPKYILNNQKKGFNAPLEKWNLDFSKFNLKEYFEDNLNMKLINKNKGNKNFRNFDYNLNTYKIWAEFN